jgi:hypothetical protein
MPRAHISPHRAASDMLITAAILEELISERQFERLVLIVRYDRVGFSADWLRAP